MATRAGWVSARASPASRSSFSVMTLTWARVAGLMGRTSSKSLIVDIRYDATRRARIHVDSGSDLDGARTGVSVSRVFTHNAIGDFNAAVLARGARPPLPHPRRHRLQRLH